MDVSDITPDYRIQSGNGPESVLYFSAYRDWSKEPEVFDYTAAASRAGATSLFARDRSNNWYHHGITGLGHSITSTAAGIAKHAAENGLNIRATVGASMGGYASLIFGALLDAPFSLCVVPQVDLTGSVEIDDTRFLNEYARIRESTADARLLMARNAIGGPSPALRVIAHGTGDETDFRHARSLIGCPGVVFMRIPEADHTHAAWHLVKNGVVDLMLQPETMRAAANLCEWQAIIEGRFQELLLHSGALLDETPARPVPVSGFPYLPASVSAPAAPAVAS